MKKFRLLYQQTTPVTLFPICFFLFVFVVVVFFSVARKLWETHAGGRELNRNAHKPLTLTRGPHTQLQMTWRAAFCTSESLSKLPSAQRSRSLEKKDFLRWLHREYISLLAFCWQTFWQVIKIKRLRTFLLLVMITKDLWWEFFESSRLN